MLIMYFLKDTYIIISFELHLKFIPVFFIVVHTVKASAVDVGEKPLIFGKYEMLPFNYKEGRMSSRVNASTNSYCIFRPAVLAGFILIF